MGGWEAPREREWERERSNIDRQTEVWSREATHEVMDPIEAHTGLQIHAGEWKVKKKELGFTKKTFSTLSSLGSVFFSLSLFQPKWSHSEHQLPPFEIFIFQPFQEHRREVKFSIESLVLQKGLFRFPEITWHKIFAIKTHTVTEIKEREEQLFNRSIHNLEIR